MCYQEFKSNYYQEMSQVFKILASPIRLQLINFISFAPRTVEDCANKFDQSVQNISLHLISLTNANLLEVEKIKNYRFYSLSDSPQMGLVARIIASDQRSLLKSEDTFKESLSIVKDKISKGEAVLIDLRASEEISYLPVEMSYHFGNPLSELKSYLQSLPKNKEYFFFCKGRMCERLYQAVEVAKGEKLKVKGLVLSACELKEFGKFLAC